MRSKIEIRNHVWKLLQKRKAARFPGADGRIPNFIGAEACAQQLGEIPYWKAAKVLKSNPDSPQAQAFRKVTEEVARQVSIEAMKPELVVLGKGQ